jgi:putative peptide zinc metalloprotease protein
MRDGVAGALSRTSIRILLAIVLVVSVATAGAWAADFVGSQTRAETPAASPSAETAATSPSATPEPADGSDMGFKLNGGGGKNIVKITNKTDNRLIVRGRVDFNRIPGGKIAPVNAAIAVASCSGCHTYAVALQINLYQRRASLVAPQNAAVAVNAGCSHCVTAARAVQYSIPVDDVKTVPHEVRELAKALDKELKGIEGVYDTSTMTAYQADVRIRVVIDEFKALADNLLNEYRVATVSNSPTPAPGASGPAVDPNATDTPPDSSCAPAPSPDPSASPDAASSPAADCTTTSPPPSEAAASASP